MDENDELSLTIGRIVRAAAYLEFNMGQLWMWLTGPSLAAHIKPNQMSALIQGAQTMLPHVDLGGDQKKWAAAAVREAGDAYGLRNRAVHDVSAQEKARSALTKTRG